MIAKPMSRLVHQAFPGRNRLATAGDRLEGAVLALGLAVTVLAVPLTGATGSEIYAHQRSRVAVEQATRYETTAVLVEDAPETIGSSERGGVVETASVLATWRLPDGSARRGEVQAHYDAQAGAAVTIWVDEHGDPSDPPMTPEGAAIDAIALALLLWAGVAGAMTLLYLATRFTHQRIRLSRWARDWERISPEWTGR
ncbi:Rv1733c family protein [Lentzea sp. NPDC055074]